jgi:SAM-dependent methyltransferase
VNDDVQIAQIDRYGLPLDTALCLNCGTLRFPRYLDENSLSDFYRNMYLDLYAWTPKLPDYFLNQQGYGRRIFAGYQEQLPSSARVLEVGCGAAGGLAAFQEQGCTVGGCELSQSQIAFGQRRGVDNLWLGTVHEMPDRLRSWQWDLIYLHHVFEHLQSPSESLQELGKLLAPNGRILVIVPDITRVDSFPNPAGDILRFLHVAHKFNYTPECLIQVAKRQNLSATVHEPPTGLTTAWSTMPELWMEFSLGPAAESSDKPGRTGEDVLTYLKKTEAMFQAGQCLAQKNAAAGPIATSPPRAPHWIKRFTRRLLGRS